MLFAGAVGVGLTWAGIAMLRGFAPVPVAAMLLLGVLIWHWQGVLVALLYFTAWCVCVYVLLVIRRSVANSIRSANV